MTSWTRALVVIGIAAAGCGDDAGLDDTEILAPYDSLRGGVVFATAAIQGSAGYDLYWAPIPGPADTNAQPAVRLTEADGHEWQPSASPGGNGIAFARDEDGIFFINPNGRVRRISDTNGTNYADSLPAVSFDGDLIAWVREDLSKPIGETGFHDTYIVTALPDGSGEEALVPKTGIVQDAPRFEPLPGSRRVAWSEFDARTLTPAGPQSFGLWLHDTDAHMGSFQCQAPGVRVGDVVYRCFGQHLAWPVPDVIIFPQNGLEFSLGALAGDNVQPVLLETLQSQQLGLPVTAPTGLPGFYRQFPMSASYLRNEGMIVDGIVDSVEGNLTTLAFFLAATDGTGVRRLFVAGHTFDYDPHNTVNFLFSVATPQIVP